MKSLNFRAQNLQILLLILHIFALKINNNFLSITWISIKNVNFLGFSVFWNQNLDFKRENSNILLFVFSTKIQITDFTSFHKNLVYELDFFGWFSNIVFYALFFGEDFVDCWAMKTDIGANHKVTQSLELSLLLLLQS